MRITLPKLAVIFAIWTLYGFLLATQRYVYTSHLGLLELPPFAVVLWRELLASWIWAFLTPGMLYCAALVPFTRARWPVAVLANCFFAGIFCVLRALFGHLLNLTTALSRNAAAPDFVSRLIGGIYDGMMMYLMVLGAWAVIEYYSRFKQRDTDAARLESQLARAELDALRNQLHPHFLFNTLNSIASLMHEDVEAADDMLADLSHMLRSCISETAQEITLAQEADLLETYLRIQKRRFEDRLSSSVDVPVELLDALVPSMLLQPLAENAVRHGLAPRVAQGTVQVRARAEGKNLLLEVLDDGLGLPAEFKEGIGIGNTRARLKQLYGSGQSLELMNTKEGTLVRVTIPLRLYPAGEDKSLYEYPNADRGRRATLSPSDPITTAD